MSTQRYFGRVGSLQIGKLQEEGLLLRGFRFTFNISKTETSESNKCSVVISNLTRNTQNKIKVESGNLLQVSLGYESVDGEEIAFIGDITDVTHDNTGPDVSTTIAAEDGRKTLRKRISVSYNGGTSAKQILKQAITDMGVPNKTDGWVDSITDKIFKEGFAFEGPIGDLMDKLTKATKVDWSLQNDELKILKSDEIDSSVVVKLTPSTGLIGSPKRIRKVDKESTDKEGSTFFGWEVRSLLQPKLEPGGQVEITCQDIVEGAQFKVVEVKHSGDTHGPDWTSSMRVKDIS